MGIGSVGIAAAVAAAAAAAVEGTAGSGCRIVHKGVVVAEVLHNAVAAVHMALEVVGYRQAVDMSADMVIEAVLVTYWSGWVLADSSEDMAKEKKGEEMSDNLELAMESKSSLVVHIVVAVVAVVDVVVVETTRGKGVAASSGMAVQDTVG